MLYLTTRTGCLKLMPKVFKDTRGFFSELYKESTYKDILPEFKQQNLSQSHSGVVRGMHTQSINPQAKWLNLLQGEIIDVVIDIRKNSSTFGQMETFHIKAMDYSLFIPADFLHGFWCLKDCLLLYNCTTEYDPKSNGGVNPTDPDINFPWKGKNCIISEADNRLPLFKDYIK